MHLLATTRRLQAPLICLLIASMVVAGCRSREEVLSLGQPLKAYQADNGSVMMGYLVQPTLKPDDAGWHWLVIEPGTARLLLQDPTPNGTDQRDRTIVVTYKGWGANARLTPALAKPGLRDSNPPVVGDGGLTELRFVWDATRRGVQLRNAGGAELPLLRVSPDFEKVQYWESRPDVWMTVLQITAVAALITGLILLGGSAEFHSN